MMGIPNPFFIVVFTVCLSGCYGVYDDIPSATINYNNDQVAAMEYAKSVHTVVSTTLFSSSTHRFLQRPNEPQQPDAACAMYEQASNGTLTCKNCKRYLQTGVEINCDFTEPFCPTASSTACWAISISNVIDVNASSLAYTTCTNVTNAPEHKSTCIRVFPGATGDYSTLDSCSGLLNDALCKSCTVCDTPPGDASISLDCSNVLNGKVQTCGSVGPNGGAFPQFLTV